MGRRPVAGLRRVHRQVDGLPDRVADRVHTIGSTSATAPRMISSGTTAMSGHVAMTPIAKPTTRAPNTTTGADRHRAELEALVAPVPPDPARRHVSCLRNQPVKNAPRPPHHAQRRRDAAPQHRRHARAVGPHRMGRDRRHDRTLRAGHARLPRCVVAWPACSSSSPRSPRPRGRRLVAAARRVRHRPQRRPRRVVLRDADIRNQIATAAGAAAAQTLGVSPEQIQAQVDTLARSDAGADLMRQIITDAHARLIGERAEPVADHRRRSWSS